MRERMAGLLAASLLGTVAMCLVLVPAAEAAVGVAAAGGGPVSGGALTSGKPVPGAVSAAAGIEYTFTAVAGKHVTVAITQADVMPYPQQLSIQAFDRKGAADTKPVDFGDNNNNVDINFTATAAEAGTTTVIVRPSTANPAATGSFTITYAKDVTGKLTSGKARNGAIASEGQRAEYTFTAVAGKHVTITITNADISPYPAELSIQAFDRKGKADTKPAHFGNGGSTPLSFTPTAREAGTTTIIIRPSSAYPQATGSFTITYRRR